MFLWILSIVVIVYVRIWIINNSFKDKSFKIELSLNVFFLSTVLVCFLFFYKDLLTFFWWENLYILNDNSWKNILSFVFYCLSFIVILSFSFGNSQKNRAIQFVMVSILLFLGIGFGGSIMWINILFMYYLSSSYAEEILKFSIWQNLFLNKNIDKNPNLNLRDLIFFAVLAGLWFSVVENIFYLVVNYITENKWVLLSIGRSIFSTLIHVVATWLIAFFVMINKNNKKKYRISIFVWILSGFILHAVYNLSLFYNIKILTIIILILCYFILSFLLFNSDIVYQKK